MTDKFLRIENVGQTFKTKRGPSTALRDVNLTVTRDGCITLIGRSGCGKSTLLNPTTELTRPTTGGLILTGREITGPGPDRAVMFQNRSLLPWLTRFDNVYLTIERVFGKSEIKTQLRDRTYAALTLVDLSHAEQKYPHEISDGMKQRVRIVCALFMGPRVLLMNGPFGALGVLTRAHLQDELLRIVAATDSTVVIVTHDVSEAVLLTDHIMMMANGPAATIDEVLTVDLPWPRDRMALAEDPTYHVCRIVVLDFLYQKQGHPVTEAA